MQIASIEAGDLANSGRMIQRQGGGAGGLSDAFETMVYQAIVD